MLRHVGSAEIEAVHRATCHCVAVALEMVRP
jgi:hypothetical protein